MPGDEDFIETPRQGHKLDIQRVTEILPPTIMESKTNTQLLLNMLPNFADKQLKLLDELGFGFLYSVPARFKPNQVLAAWLLTILNTETMELIDPTSGIKAKCDAAAVRRILGVGGGKTRVDTKQSHGGHASRKRAEEMITIQGSKPQLSLSKARAVLVYLHTKEPMTASEEEKFTAALITYVIGTFLAPQPATASTPIDKHITRIICHPKEATKYDWGSYTLLTLKKAAGQIQKQMMSQPHQQHIEVQGCTTLLLVSKKKLTTKFCTYISSVTPNNMRNTNALSADTIH
jgi:hypothetical protein